MASGPTTDRMLALFALGVVVLNFPLLAAIDRAWSTPLLWIGIYCLWTLLIVLTRLLFRRGNRQEDEGD